LAAGWSVVARSAHQKPLVVCLAFAVWRARVSCAIVVSPSGIGVGGASTLALPRWEEVEVAGRGTRAVGDCGIMHSHPQFPSPSPSLDQTAPAAIEQPQLSDHDMHVLRELAAMHGVALDYRDGLGDRVEPGAATLIAVLRALGL